MLSFAHIFWIQRRSRVFDDFLNDWDNRNIFGNTLTIPWIGIYGTGYMERRIDATGYNNLYIQYMLTYSEDFILENNEYCGLYFKQNGIKTYIQIWNQEDIVSISHYHQSFYLPKLLDNTSDIYIGFDNNGTRSQNGQCYVRYTKLSGILLNSTNNDEQYYEIWLIIIVS